nr:hypothetical protein [Tanacetum cinerariifolium]
KKWKRKVTRDASGSTLPSKKLSDDYQSLPPNTCGKSLAVLRSMISKGYDIPSGVTKSLLTASVAPTSDVGPTDCISRLSLRTLPPHERFPAADAPIVTIAVTTIVVADVATGSKAKDISKYFENIRDSASAGGMNANAVSFSKLKWKVTNDSILEDPYVFQDLTDRLAPPALFTQLRVIDYDQHYFKFNIGAARQVCLGAKVRMRAEHTLEKKDKLEDKCAEKTTLLSERDAEIC